MSVPYGAPQQQPQGPAQQQSVGLNLQLILPLVAAGLALIAYLLAFTDEISSGDVQYLLAAGLLAGLVVLPRVPNLLPAAAVLSVIPALLILQSIIKTDADVEGMQIVLLIVALLEAAAIVVALLMQVGILKFEPKPVNVYGQPGGWNPQSGSFPQTGQHPQQGQFGQQQPPSGQFGAQQPPQAPPAAQPTSFMPQPGQFGQPQQGQPQQGQQLGTPPGGFGGPTQG
ncbi:DUF5336 domain-containing protein [Umezawaea beigongshangensis]|uniref:DUF5336 domain-containing protein n=1 Tax=Umezawaea beigongshangensis TaxID=2780383 RepID=UPI0018F265EB|nr:DUF5336 domain-containing protein [Umezawaea beigongshangensis]